jgi:hypothetical protein
MARASGPYIPDFVLPSEPLSRGTPNTVIFGPKILSLPDSASPKDTIEYLMNFTTERALIIIGTKSDVLSAGQIVPNLHENYPFCKIWE